MSRVINFGAGPAKLPEEVSELVQLFLKNILIKSLIYWSFDYFFINI